MSIAADHTWLVTGSSRGFGRALTVAALKAGDRVVATARTPAALEDLVDRFEEQILAGALDVTDPSAAASAVEAGVIRYGRVNVVVNNAGYANVAPVETAPETAFRRQFETNFWGRVQRVEGGPARLRGIRYLVIEPGGLPPIGPGHRWRSTAFPRSTRQRSASSPLT